MTGRNTDYYDQAFGPLRQGDLDIGAPAAPPSSLDTPPSSLAPPVPFTWGIIYLTPTAESAGYE